MPIVAIAGACSRAGKTALAETFLRALPPGEALALKFTTTEDVFERCPRGAPCVVCDIDVPFRIVLDPRILNEPGTDTARLARAGAGLVVWAIARASAIERAWEAVSQIPSFASALTILEGSTIVDHARPDLLAFVVHPFLSVSRWKPTSGPLIERADAVVVNMQAESPPSPSSWGQAPMRARANLPSGQRAPNPRVLSEIARHCPGKPVRVADVSQKLGAWAPDLLERVSGLLPRAVADLSPTSA